MSTVERIKMYLDYRNIPVRRAEKESGVSNATFANAMKNPKGTVGSDKIESFLRAYPEVSAEWLLRGTGPMLIGEGENHEQIFKAMNLPPNSGKIIEVWMKFMEVTEGMQEVYKLSKSNK